jgi:thiol-disulfide isomerase/thioredoxin
MYSHLNRIVIGVACLAVVAACAPAGGGNPAESSDVMVADSVRGDLPDLGLAPEIQSEVWINTAEPLRLADLRGKVVLLNMWTFGCINCQRVIPYVKAWHASYAEQGLVVIGNHFPEFQYEADLGNLEAAVSRLDIQYAVAQDNEGQTWNAYRNRYWPTVYLIDKQGHLRYQHIGEGAYASTEAAIQALLAEAN